MIKNILVLFSCIVLFSAPLKASSPGYKYYALQNWSESIPNGSNFDMTYLQWSSELSGNGFWQVELGAGSLDCGSRTVSSSGGGMKFDLGDSSTFDIGVGYTVDVLTGCGVGNSSDTSNDFFTGLRFAISDSSEGYVRMKASDFQDGTLSDRTEMGFGVVFYLGPFVGVEIGAGTISYDFSGVDNDFVRLALRFRR